MPGMQPKQNKDNFNRLLLFIISCIFSLSLFSQTIEFIEPRNVQNFPQASFSTYIVGDHLYILQKKYRMESPISFDLQLDVYNGQRKPIGSHVIDKSLEVGDANIYKGIFALKDRLVMFKSEFSKLTGEKLYHLHYYLFESNGIRKKKTLLRSIRSESAFNSGNFVISASPDGSKLAVLSELPYNKDGIEKCLLSVYDQQFGLLWEKAYEFPYESTKVPNNDVFVNNQGKVFILKRIKAKKQFDRFSLFTFGANGQNVIEKKVEFGNAFTISTYKHIINDQGDLILAGYYYNDKNVGINVETPDGLFYLRVDAVTGDLDASRFTPVKPQKQNLVALQVISLPGNEVLLLGEQQFVSTRPIPGKLGEYNYEYTNRTISLSKMTSDGSLAWEYNMDRELKSENDGGRFLSTFAWARGEEIHLVFADHLYRRDEAKQVVIGPGLAGVRVAVLETIGSDGKLKASAYVKDIRIGGKNGEYMFIPGSASIFGSSVFLLSARGVELVGTKLNY
jgi:hypothetical protein